MCKTPCVVAEMWVNNTWTRINKKKIVLTLRVHRCKLIETRKRLNTKYNDNNNNVWRNGFILIKLRTDFVPMPYNRYKLTNTLSFTHYAYSSFSVCVCIECLDNCFAIEMKKRRKRIISKWTESLIKLLCCGVCACDANIICTIW